MKAIWNLQTELFAVCLHANHPLGGNKYTCKQIVSSGCRYQPFQRTVVVCACYSTIVLSDMLLSKLQCLIYVPQELKNRLKSADYQEKIYLLKMIGTFGHRSLNQPLLDIIKDNRNTLELRITAVYALRRIAPRIPQKVITINSKPSLSKKAVLHTSVVLMFILRDRSKFS